MDNVVSLVIGGQTIDFDITKDTSITDIDQDMRQIPGLIAWYGRALGVARGNVVIVDGAYRKWRAALASAQVDKTAEHKIKSAIESQPKFRDWKGAIAEAEETVVRIEKAYEALKVKADMLRSLGARERDEMHTIGVETRMRSDSSEETREEKKKRLKEAFKKQKDGDE